MVLSVVSGEIKLDTLETEKESRPKEGGSSVWIAVPRLKFP